MLATNEIIELLTREGFRLDGPYVKMLTSRGYISPPAKIAGRFLWQKADADRLRSILRRRGRGPGGENPA